MNSHELQMHSNEVIQHVISIRWKCSVDALRVAHSRTTESLLMRMKMISQPKSPKCEHEQKSYTSLKHPHRRPLKNEENKQDIDWTTPMSQWWVGYSAHILSCKIWEMALLAAKWMRNECLFSLFNLFIALLMFKQNIIVFIGWPKAKFWSTLAWNRQIKKNRNELIKWITVSRRVQASEWGKQVVVCLWIIVSWHWAKQRQI